MLAMAVVIFLKASAIYHRSFAALFFSLPHFDTARISDARHCLLRSRRNQQHTRAVATNLSFPFPIYSESGEAFDGSSFFPAYPQRFSRLCLLSSVTDSPGCEYSLPLLLSFFFPCGGAFSVVLLAGISSNFPLFLHVLTCPITG